MALRVRMLLKKGTKKKIRTTVAFMVALAVVLVSFSGALAADTGWWKNPSANAADTGGDGDGFETNPANAYTDGAGAALNSGGIGDSHCYYNYGFSIPANATINGIEVRLDWYLNVIAQANNMEVELSWDEGSSSSWTTPKTDSNLTIAEHTTILGGPDDIWDHAWNGSEFSDVNFRVRLTCNSSIQRDFYLDWVPVKVYYTPNQPPVITGQNPDPLTTPEETPLAITLANLAVSDPDNTYPDDFTLVVQDGANYTRVGNTITPDTDFNGTLTVPATVNDGTDDSNVFNISVNVTAVNDPPVITGQNPDPLTTPEETPLAITLANLAVSDP
ncbi:hypothetical protein KAX17_10225, partial [Candidatus Bipolaricaulota bacterium]|nr:hypothetical protein [Candidatus Bipolaricaulota bacterium]